MIIESKSIEGKDHTWILRCPIRNDASELSELRMKIDGETENLDREAGEAFLSEADFQELIEEDAQAARSLFLIAEIDDKLIGYARCEGNTLRRFQHKAEFGIGILRDYWGLGVGRTLLETTLSWGDAARIEKISLNVVETNEKAIQLYKKCGFVEEGLLRKDRIHRDGYFYNTVVMGRFINS